MSVMMPNCIPSIPTSYFITTAIRILRAVD